MKLPTMLALGAVLAGATAAWAAGLTDGDLRYLKMQYGLEQGDPLIAGMSSDEQATLHDRISDPRFSGRPGSRDASVADELFGIHLRQCQTWAQTHMGHMCPPGTNTSVEPGRELADDQCSACHLFGTTDAPSFFQLAKKGPWTPERLGDALKKATGCRR
jgi:hypothetical protein